jgi:ribosomal protein S18 acetylase RimI-like enzyme
MAYEIIPYRREHATVSAKLHAAGQPGTFLTSLGPAFLRALYTQIAESSLCFGYVAVDGDEVVGVVTGAVDAGALFKELVLKRGHKLILPVLGSVLRRPAQLARIVQTLFYPSQVKPEPGETEMLFLSSRADRRGEGIGYALYWAFIEGSRARGYRAVGLSVDVSNTNAVRFHERQGMHLVREFGIYGRTFRWYVLPIGPEQS